MESQSQLLTGIHKTPNYFKTNEWQRNTPFAKSYVYYTSIAVYTNTKECQCMANVPLQ